MYTPPAFAESDLPKLHDFIKGHSFAVLISSGVELTASQLPFLLDGSCGPQGRLIGHMAKANPQWREASGKPVLVVFAGPHAYISPSWYEAENVVPTWNYVAVHVYGAFRLIDDQDRVMKIVADMVKRYEEPRSRPWTLDPAAEHLRPLTTQIVGFEIDIERIEGKWKLSQNHPPDRRRRVVQGLAETNDAGAIEIARLMEETLSDGNSP